MIKIGISPGKGRGLYALTAFDKGTTIEAAPALQLDTNDWQKVEKSSLFPYVFAEPSNYCPTRADRSGYVVLGLQTFCNHDNLPNAEVHWQKNGLGHWALLVALKSIQPDEEITIYYTNLEEYSDIKA